MSRRYGCGIILAALRANRGWRAAGEKKVTRHQCLVANIYIQKYGAGNPLLTAVSSITFRSDCGSPGSRATESTAFTSWRISATNLTPSSGNQKNFRATVAALYCPALHENHPGTATVAAFNTTGVTHRPCSISAPAEINAARRRRHRSRTPDSRRSSWPQTRQPCRRDRIPMSGRDVP